MSFARITIARLHLEFIQRFEPAVKHTVEHKFRSNDDFEMGMGYMNYIMEEQKRIKRLFPSDLDENEDRIFQFSRYLHVI